MNRSTLELVCTELDSLIVQYWESVATPGCDLNDKKSRNIVIFEKHAGFFITRENVQNHKSVKCQECLS
jgi:hypothetical protein